jgi:hypothetical protein
MADWSAQYVPALIKAMHNSAPILGTDPLGAPRAQYLVMLELLAVNAMTLKIIQDLHPDLATDSEFQHRLDIALDTGADGDKSGWPGWVLLQVPPEMLAQYGATEADSADVLQAKMDAYNNGPH